MSRDGGEEAWQWLSCERELGGGTGGLNAKRENEREKERERERKRERERELADCIRGLNGESRGEQRIARATGATPNGR